MYICQECNKEITEFEFKEGCCLTCGGVYVEEL